MEYPLGLGDSVTYWTQKVLSVRGPKISNRAVGVGAVVQSEQPKSLPILGL